MGATVEALIGSLCAKEDDGCFSSDRAPVSVGNGRLNHCPEALSRRIIFIDRKVKTTVYSHSHQRDPHSDHGIRCADDRWMPLMFAASS
mmetsp:Transcript_47291/g.115460  ORF Transcript_47291/g.115460 Transcript_47291/m.115460 type:complete len:89 (+) Transcript_47291:1202-1468(+)